MRPMNEIPDDQYIKTRKQLLIERNAIGSFEFLTPDERVYLDYYYGLNEDFASSLALTYRTWIANEYSWLPERAGKALKKLRPYFGVHVTRATSTKQKRGAPRSAAVFAELNPNFKPEDLANIIVRAGMDQARRERESLGQPANTRRRS